MAAHLIVFARVPAPGLAKTRLLNRLSPEAAAGVYEAFLRDTVHNADVADADVKVLAFAPDDAEFDMRRFLPAGWRLRPQGQGDLGHRMDRALNACLQGGGDRAVLIGTDVPSLPVGHLREAFDLLRHRDVVLGPSTDGGYYLVGLGHPAQEIFHDIRWSTRTVFQETVSRIRAAGLTLGLVPPWYDVDLPEDLDFLLAHTEARMRAGEPPLLVHTRKEAEKWRCGT